MDKNSTIIVTGAAGFIASCLVSYLNENGFEKLILVDEFGDHEKELNLNKKKYTVKVERENLFEWLANENPDVKFVYHLGARTDTTEFDYSIHEHLNVEYSKKIWNYCTVNNIPLVYASSAATYGAGELGYNDDHDVIQKLQPLNPYGVSKNEFDKWVLLQNVTPPFWSGLKFFNVYGPNEYHKSRMASMIFHSYHQIHENGFVKLFKSHKEGYKDGEQLRDFIYVKDVIKMCYWIMGVSQQSTVKSQHKLANGIYNIGTGKARTFNDLINAVFSALNVEPDIRYIDMPNDLRDTYQYFTEAKMEKIKTAGYNFPLYTLEEGVENYVTDYLLENKYY